MLYYYIKQNMSLTADIADQFYFSPKLDTGRK